MAGAKTRHPLAPTRPIEMLSTFTFMEASPNKTAFIVIWTPLNPTPEVWAAFDGGAAA